MIVYPSRTRSPPLLLHIRDLTGHRPHISFEWTEGHPLNFLNFRIGVGEAVPRHP